MFEVSVYYIDITGNCIEKDSKYSKNSASSVFQKWGRLGIDCIECRGMVEIYDIVIKI